MKVLMVCLGNICRSPLAEGILKNKLEAKQLDWQVDSAGTGNWHIGELPDPRSIQVAKKYGIDITDQRAQQFKAKHLEEYDLILAMDSSNKSNILKLANSGTQRDKVKLMMDFAENKVVTDVPDPYWDDNGFEQVYQMLDKACDNLLEAYPMKY